MNHGLRRSDRKGLTSASRAFDGQADKYDVAEIRARLDVGDQASQWDAAEHRARLVGDGQAGTAQVNTVCDREG